MVLLYGLIKQGYGIKETFTEDKKTAPKKRQNDKRNTKFSQSGEASYASQYVYEKDSTESFRQIGFLLQGHSCRARWGGEKTRT